MNTLGIGEQVDNRNISVLAYADDVVVLAETEEELNTLLGTLSWWCDDNKMSVNPGKSKEVHFRRSGAAKTTHYFMCGDIELDIVDCHTN